jgi:hypothetical protein
VLVAVGCGQPCSFLGDQESSVVVSAGDVEPHHISQFVDNPVRLKVLESGQGPELATRAQPRVEQIALSNGSDHRWVGAFEFHATSTEFDHVAGRDAAWGAVKKIAVDDGAKFRNRQHIICPHQILDFKATFFADGL